MGVAESEFGETLKLWKDGIDQALESWIDRCVGCPRRLREAMKYSVLAGGKRLRPLLVLLSADSCLGHVESAMPAACAVEFVHTYSLIHDDLPAMDNDDLRRGLPTCHRKYDEATAILAGDALLTLAFEALTVIEPSRTAVDCVKILSRAAGVAGMVGGQMDDLTAANGPGTIEWLELLHQRKTGALLSASLELGATIANAQPEHFDAIRQYGRCIGLAFQIADDLLDVEGSEATLGKGVLKDQNAGKLTYPMLLGVEESRRRARQLGKEAREALRPLGPSGHRLAMLAEFIVERDR